MITFVTIIPRLFLLGFYSIINPTKANKLKYKGKPIIPIVVLCITISTYLVCIFVITRWYVQKLKLDFLINDIANATSQLNEATNPTSIKYLPEDINEEFANISYLDKDLTELIKQNSDTVGWIYLNNTNVDYPVLQYKDNDYYLKHDFNKRSNYNGWVFADYRDDFKYFGTNTIVYAHNLVNRKMFGSLVWCLKESWYTNEDNRYIKVSTPIANTVWQIFSIYVIPPESYYIKTYFATKEEHQEFLKKITERSIYDFKVKLDTDDKVLTLSTCTDDGTKRVVIHSKLIKVAYKEN